MCKAVWYSLRTHFTTPSWGIGGFADTQLFTKWSDLENVGERNQMKELNNDLDWSIFVCLFHFHKILQIFQIESQFCHFQLDFCLTFLWRGEKQNSNIQLKPFLSSFIWYQLYLYWTILKQAKLLQINIELWNGYRVEYWRAFLKGSMLQNTGCLIMLTFLHHINK